MKKLIKKYGSGNAISTGGTENTSPLTGNAAYDYSNNFENQLLNRLKNNQGMSGGWNLGGSVNSLGGDIASTLGGSVAKSVGKELIANGSKAALGSAAKSGLSSGLKGLTSSAGLWGAAMGVASSLIGNKSEYSGDKGGITQGLDSAFDTVSDALMLAGPAGTTAGLIMKGGNLLGKGLNKWTGSGTDGMTTTDAVLGSSFFNLLPISMINGWAGKRSNSMGLTGWQDQENLNNVWNAYTGSQKQDMTASRLANKKYGLLSEESRQEANDKINVANMNRSSLENMSDVTTLGNIRGNGMVSINNQNYYNKLLGGINANSTYIGRSGLKLPTATDIQDIRKKMNSRNNTLKKQRELINKIDTSKEIDKIDISDVTKVPQFKEGGTVNVIPEGALHARLNKMEGGGETITKKGIPVVDNNGTQQAEIENNEIIFRKEVTTEIEKLEKDGSDQAAIQCGKLLAFEILENTEDRTGLTQTLKKGGPVKPLSEGTSNAITGSISGIFNGISTGINAQEKINQEKIQQEAIDNYNNSITNQKALTRAQNNTINSLFQFTHEYNPGQNTAIGTMDIDQKQLDNAVKQQQESSELQNTQRYVDLVNADQEIQNSQNKANKANAIVGVLGSTASALGQKAINNYNTTGNIFKEKVTSGQEGTKLNIDKIKETASKQNPPFLQRILNNNRTSIVIPILHGKQNTEPSTHLMSSMDNIVFPLVQMENNKLISFIDDKGEPKWQEARENAIKHNNYIEFESPEEADWYANNYKQFYPEYFNNKF